MKIVIVLSQYSWFYAKVEARVKEKIALLFSLSQCFYWVSTLVGWVIQNITRNLVSSKGNSKGWRNDKVVIQVVSLNHTKSMFNCTESFKILLEWKVII